MLPGELQATVQEVEQLAGCEIGVVPDAAASEFDSLTFGIEAGVCRATIAYRGDSISCCAIVHEVLHLKRYWLEGVPILRPTASRYQSEAQALDDLIEHLVIIPEEHHFAEAESNAHWSAVMRAKVAELPTVGQRDGLGRFGGGGLNSAPSQAEVVALQRSLMLQRAMMDIALPDLDHASLYDRLRDENLLEASGAFSDRLRNMLTDKMRALIFAGQEFRYDLTAFCVGRFNLRASPKNFWRSAPLTQ
jgi:hypothetical protein